MYVIYVIKKLNFIFWTSIL